MFVVSFSPSSPYSVRSIRSRAALRRVCFVVVIHSSVVFVFICFLFCAFASFLFLFRFLRVRAACFSLSLSLSLTLFRSLSLSLFIFWNLLFWFVQRVFAIHCWSACISYICDDFNHCNRFSHSRSFVHSVPELCVSHLAESLKPIYVYCFTISSMSSRFIHVFVSFVRWYSRALFYFSSECCRLSPFVVVVYFIFLTLTLRL